MIASELCWLRSYLVFFKIKKENYIDLESHAFINPFSRYVQFEHKE